MEGGDNPRKPACPPFSSQSSVGAVATGHTIVRNEQASPFGAGWNLRGVDRLLVTPLGDMAILAQGTGHTVPFVSASAANLVSWWQGEGTATDPINGNHGTLVGGLGYASGQIGQAFAFDGVDDAIDIPDSTSLDSLTTAATISLWAKPEPPEGASNLGYLFYRYDPAAGQGLGLAVNIAGAVAFTVRTTVASSIFYTAPGAVAFGTLSHIAATVDTATGQSHIYVNGVEVPHTTPLGAEIVSGTLVNVDALYLGRRYGGGVVDDAYYKGLMDEVWLYGRALAGTEINAIYTAGGIREMAGTFLPPPGDTSTLTKEADGTFTRRLKDGTVYRFNAQGYQTSRADRNGNTTTYAYNGSRQLTTITDPVGQVTTFGYNGDRVATITDPAGRVTTLTHDSAGNLLAVEAPDQTRTSFNYDAQHRMVQKRDARGQVFAYQFDFAGRLKQVVLPNGDSRLLRPTDLTGVPDLAQGIGVAGNPATISQPPVIQATFTDAKGQTTTFETDAIGRVTKQIDPLSRVTTIQRDPQGNPITITRPNGAITTMTYDAKANLLTSTEAAIAATTTFVYEPTFNQVTRITDPKGNQTNITYDAKGNPLTITDADQKVTTFLYNAQGLLTETRDALYPANPATTFTYDPLGRLQTTTDPLGRTTTLTYDSAGNVATSKDALNRITAFAYDVKNRLTQVTDPLNGVTQYTYDANGNLLTVKDAKNQVTSFAYDSRNRLIKTTDPLGKVEQYTYDGNDNLLTRVTPKAETISFAYDAVNRLLSKTLPASTGLSTGGTEVTSYAYDLVGNLTNVTDPDS
ncbi:MAG: hypothetical protein OEY86_14465, partial [Nitrospira sp.]|nr:hypothetical protein [Nitrospira sp.]